MLDKRKEIKGRERKNIRDIDGMDMIKICYVHV